MQNDKAGVYSSAITETKGYFEQAKPTEGFPMVDEALREALTLMVRIAGTDAEDEQQSLLGRLIQLQEQNNVLVALLASGFGVGVNNLGNDDNRIMEDISNGLAATYASLQIADFLSKGALSDWILKTTVTYLKPLLAAYGLPVAVTATLAAGGIYYLSTHNPEWVTYEPKSQEELDAFLEKGSAGLFGKQEFIEGYGDTPSGRSAYLSYLAGNNWSLYEQEKAITDQYVSFSEAERMRIEKGLPDPYPKMPDGIAMGKWLNSQGSILYPDANLVLNGIGEVFQSPFANIGVLNGGTKDIGGIATTPSGTGMLTGEGPEMALPCDCVFGVQNSLAERLTGALERMVEVCALPRVSVAKIAETVVIREEADLDALVRRIADELLRAELLS